MSDFEVVQLKNRVKELAEQNRQLWDRLKEARRVLHVIRNAAESFEREPPA